MQHRPPPISDRARGRWRDILVGLGVPAQFLNGKHQPCPVCGGKDRARFDDKAGKGTYFCNNCGSGDGVKLLQTMHGWDFKRTVQEIEKVIGGASFVEPSREQTDDRAKQALRKAWVESRPVEAGDPVTRYLARRGIRWTPEISNLRYHEGLTYRHDNGKYTRHPAMLAVVMDAAGVPVIIHRTYLTLDGRKADVPTPRKVMTGQIPMGSAIRLFPPEEELGVAEGIENALAANRMSWIPVWSVLNATLLTSWEPPAGVKRVHIFGDNDGNFTGQVSAYTLARRLAVKGVEVQVRLPNRTGTDWNDVLLSTGETP